MRIAQYSEPFGLNSRFYSIMQLLTGLQQTSCTLQIPTLPRQTNWYLGIFAALMVDLDRNVCYDLNTSIPRILLQRSD
jgi:hypothetical protein